MSPESRRSSAEPLRRWPNRRLQALLDGLSDGIVAANLAGLIVYANAAAEELLEATAGELLGTPVIDLFPPRLQSSIGEGFASFVTERMSGLVGKPQEGVLVRRTGAEVPVEVSVDVVPAGRHGSVVVGVVRQRRAERLTRWSDLTQRLFDMLADAGGDVPAAARLLETLGSELGWEATTLWSLDADGELVRRALWSDPVTDPEGRLHRARPPRASEGATLPVHALESGQAFWVSDLRADARFASGRAAATGLRGVVVCPVRYGGAVLGVVELFSTEPRPADPELVELVDAVSGPIGQLLVALERADERERLVADLEQARRDQAFLLDAIRVLGEASDYQDTLERLGQVAIPRLADLCIIDVLDEHGRFRRLVCQHHDPAKAALVRELRQDFPPDPFGLDPSVDVVQQRRSRWSPTMSDEFLRQTTRNRRHFHLVKSLEFTSYITVPLTAEETAIGSVTLVSAGSGRRFDERDVVSAEQLAVQVGSVVERARRHEREHRIAHTLQQSLLPDQLPTVPHLELAARYEPGSDFTDVGGDWYDVVELGDRVALVVGDVEGHDMRAASVMAKLRHGLSAVLSETPTPAAALERLDHFATSSGTERMATVLIVTVDPESGALSMASAGHPPPIVTDGDRVSLVDLDVDPPVGSRLARSGHESSLVVADGGLLLYTDGLVENRRHDVGTGLQQLVESVAGAPERAPGALCDHVLGEMLAGEPQGDDVVLLAARLDRRAS